MTKLEDLVGTWEVVDFQRENPEGEVSAWGEELCGYLVYSPEGFMSGTLNRKVEDRGERYKDILRSHLFYAGPFTLKGETVTHHVRVASWRPRIGRDELRYISWEGEQLVLEDRGDFGRARITWRRVTPHAADGSPLQAAVREP